MTFWERFREDALFFQLKTEDFYSATEKVVFFQVCDPWVGWCDRKGMTPLIANEMIEP